jgi:hypothetical protein
MFAIIVFWIFQVINGLTALGMFFQPKKFHESTFKEPARVYRELGFSEVAVEMLHNVLRGQGAALLAISITLFYLGAASRASFVLIALTCGLSLIGHILTARHHLKSEAVMKALGGIQAMYVILILNATVLVGATVAFLQLER